MKSSLAILAVLVVGMLLVNYGEADDPEVTIQKRLLEGLLDGVLKTVTDLLGSLLSTLGINKGDDSGVLNGILGNIGGLNLQGLLEGLFKGKDVATVVQSAGVDANTLLSIATSILIPKLNDLLAKAKEPTAVDQNSQMNYLSQLIPYLSNLQQSSGTQDNGQLITSLLPYIQSYIKQQFPTAPQQIQVPFPFPFPVNPPQAQFQIPFGFSQFPVQPPRNQFPFNLPFPPPTSSTSTICRLPGANVLPFCQKAPAPTGTIAILCQLPGMSSLPFCKNPFTQAPIPDLSALCQLPGANVLPACVKKVPAPATSSMNICQSPLAAFITACKTLAPP